MIGSVPGVMSSEDPCDRSGCPRSAKFKVVSSDLSAVVSKCVVRVMECSDELEVSLAF